MKTHYHVFGPGEPVRLGRKSFLKQIADAISKDTPDNLMIVGPKLIGKSTLLRDIPDSINLVEAGYVAHVHWNLGHGTPSDDVDFLMQFRTKVRVPLLNVRPELSDWFDDNQKPYDSLDGALDELWEGGGRLLVVMDSFDHVLKRARLTRNLWDNLADLLRKPGLTLITGSRVPLLDLCGDEETITSELWELFDSEPVRIGPFGKGEWKELVDHLESDGFQIEQDVEDEVFVQTGGVPVLVCAVFRRLQENGEKVISSRMVAQAAERILNSEPTFLGELWAHCDSEEQSALAAIASEPNRVPSLPHDRKNSLLQRGYLMENRRGAHCSCEIMRKYAARYGTSVEDVHRIFGSPDDYCRRIREVLEIRLSHLNDADSTLLNFVKRTLRDLDVEPEIPVYDMRGIAERAISLVVDAEFPDGKIDPSWVSVWQHGGATHPSEALQGRVPIDNGRRADLFLLMTGDKKASVIRKVSNHISKGTALLIAHLWTIGRAGVHRDENHEYGPLFAGSACFAAVELCEHLARELPKSSKAPGQ